MKLLPYIELFISEKKNYQNLSDKTLLAYRYDLNELLEIPFSSFDDIQILFSTQLQKLNKSTLSDTTKRRKIISYNLFSKFLHERDLIPHTNLSFLKQKFIVNKKLPKTISSSDVEALLTYAYKRKLTATSISQTRTRIRNQAILELLCSTGIRIGELSNILLSDFDLTTKTLIIHGKNRKERLLYISSAEVLQALQDYLDIRSLFPEKTEHFFLNKYGTQLSIYSISNIFNEYKAATNIPKQATPHSLRHTFATELLNNGANIRAVQELLGHSSIVTTEIYTQITTAEKVKVLNAFNFRNNLTIR